MFRKIFFEWHRSNKVKRKATWLAGLLWLTTMTSQILVDQRMAELNTQFYLCLLLTTLLRAFCVLLSGDFKRASSLPGLRTCGARKRRACSSHFPLSLLDQIGPGCAGRTRFPSWTRPSGGRSVWNSRRHTGTQSRGTSRSMPSCWLRCQPSGEPSVWVYFF